MARQKVFSVCLCIALFFGLFVGCNSENHVSSESAAATKPTLHCEVLPAVPVTEPILFDECTSAPGTKLSEAIAAHNHTVSYSPQRPWSVDDWVATTVEETISWVDSVGNHNVVTVRLPHLCSGKQFAYEYNSSMDAFGSQIIARDVLILAQEADDDGFTKALRERTRNEQEALEAAIRVKYNTKG